MMLLALFLPLLLLPNPAYAAGLDVAIPTIISISKLIFLALGAVSIFRVVLAASSGQPITKNLWGALVATLFPALALTVLDYMATLSPTTSAAGATHAGGRPWLEYVLAQTGLLTSTRVYHWLVSRGLEVAGVFAAGASAFVIAWAGDGWQKFRSWAWVSGLILIIFWPGWTMRVANSSQAVMQANGAQIQNFKNIQAGAGPKSQGGSVVGSITAIQIHPNTKKLSINSDAPVVLSLINSSFDGLVSGLNGVIGGSKFLAFGLRNSVSFSKMLGSSIQNQDIRQQAQFFIQNCYSDYISKAGGGQKSLTAYLKNPASNADKFKIFGKAAMAYYSTAKVSTAISGNGQLTTCKAIATGPHTLYGLKWSHGLRDLVIADLAYQDPWLLKKYKWRGPADALADVARLKREDYGTIWSTSSVVRNYHSTNAADALVDQMMRKESFAFGYNSKSATSAGQDPKYSRGGYEWLTKLAVFGTSTMGNIKSAIIQESVNARIPAFMALIQALVLSLYPLIWLYSLFPGQAKHLIDAFLLLFWAKSYSIAWAVISILDQQVGLYNPSGITDNPNNSLLLAGVVMDAQYAAPILMAAVVMGFRSAAQGGFARLAG